MSQPERARGAAWGQLVARLSLSCLLAGSLACGGSTKEEEPSAEEGAQAPAGIQIRSATYGTALTPQQRITAPVTEFAPTDPVSISLALEGRPRSGVVTLRWPFDSETAEAQVDLSDVNGGVLFSVGMVTYVGGTLSHEGPLPPGEHETVVLYEGREVGRYPYRVAAPPASIAGPFVSPPSRPPPAAVDPLPASTPVIYGAWSHPAVPANEHLTFTLVAVEVGEAAPPMTEVSVAEMDAAEGGAVGGPLDFSLPRPWPPGRYRIVGSGSTLGEFATLDFTIQ